MVASTVSAILMAISYKTISLVLVSLHNFPSVCSLFIYCNVDLISQMWMSALLMFVIRTALTQLAVSSVAAMQDLSLTLMDRPAMVSECITLCITL